MIIYDQSISSSMLRFHIGSSMDTPPPASRIVKRVRHCLGHAHRCVSCWPLPSFARTHFGS